MRKPLFKGSKAPFNHLRPHLHVGRKSWAVQGYHGLPQCSRELLLVRTPPSHALGKHPALQGLTCPGLALRLRKYKGHRTVTVVLVPVKKVILELMPAAERVNRGKPPHAPPYDAGKYKLVSSTSPNCQRAATCLAARRPGPIKKMVCSAISDEANNATKPELLSVPGTPPNGLPSRTPHLNAVQLADSRSQTKTQIHAIALVRTTAPV